MSDGEELFQENDHHASPKSGFIFRRYMSVELELTSQLVTTLLYQISGRLLETLVSSISTPNIEHF